MWLYNLRWWLLIVIIVIIIIIVIVICLSHHPHYALYPYNYAVAKWLENKTFYSKREKIDIFPDCQFFEQNWLGLREEAVQVLDLANDNVWKEFYAADDKFWQGWNIYTLRLYGINVEENMKRCPLTSQLIRQCPYIHTAVFSILEPGKVITPHYGPFKGILRYHLGLVIPDGDCYIQVGDDRYYWREGEGILFDETYLHSAHNNTDKLRVVLYLDIPRPMPHEWLDNVNDWILWAIEQSPNNRRAIKQRVQHNK